jgi:hypothetical protein
VHGTAGLALAVFVVSLARCLPADSRAASRRALVVAGIAAAIVSLVQLGLEIGLNRHVAARGAAGTTARLFHAVNVADTIKLILLAVAVAAATRLGTRLPAWLRALGVALAPILVLGGLAFVIDSGALSAVLVLSLLLLLVWVASIAVLVPRRFAPG